MSSLFVDAMRAAIYCNASGWMSTDGWASDATERARAWAEARMGLCPSERYFYEDTLFCDLAAGHAGDHTCTEDYADDDDIAMEVRWRNKP